MPTIEVSTLLFQAGGLGVFVWFVLVWSDRMTKSQDARDAAMQKFWDEQRINDRIVLSELTTSIKRLCGQFDQHDQKTDVAIATMTERTKAKAQIVRRKSLGED